MSTQGSASPSPTPYSPNLRYGRSPIGRSHNLEHKQRMMLDLRSLHFLILDRMTKLRFTNKNKTIPYSYSDHN